MPADASQFLGGASSYTSSTLEKLRKGVERFGAMVIGNAAELAPVDTGDLKGSAIWTPATISGITISMTIGFTVDYSVFVHENLNAHHDQGQAKFLEIEMSNMGPAFEPFMQSQTGGA